jgi:methylmalonyl-CoA mutase N-terminal domain/subunit
MQAHIAAFHAYKAQRSQGAVQAAQDALAAAANDTKQNVFARVVEAAEAGCTHGEICATLRRELGFGQPLVVI